jgi:hypothetical protein
LERREHPAETEKELSDFLRNPFPPDDVVAEDVAPWGVHRGITRLHIRSHCRM